MNPLIPIYEFFGRAFGIYENKFSIIFQTLYNKGGYFDMTLMLLLIPLVFLLLFYILWEYPLTTLCHWLLIIFTIALIVGVTTYSSLTLTLTKFIINADPRVVDFTEILVLKYAVLNAFLSLIVSFIYSLTFCKFKK